MRKPSCKQCKKIVDAVSNNRLCIDCAMDNIRETSRQLKAKEGPIWEAYKEKMIQVLGLK